MVKRRTVPTANRPPPTGNPNRLLAALPAADYSRIAPVARTSSRSSSKTFFTNPVNPIRHVYFPGGGFCSMLTVLEDGGMVEVATVGREGMVGVSAVWTAARSSSAVDGAGRDGHLLPDDGGRLPSRDGSARRVLRIADALRAGAHRVHHAVDGLQRGSLGRATTGALAVDGAGPDGKRTNFPLTQEFVAMMLGASRPTVTVVAGTLQKAGLITYHRGQRDDRGPREARSRVVRMLPDGDGSAQRR